MSQSYNTDEIINFNLILLTANEDIRPLELRGIDKKILDNNVSQAIFDKMCSENLITTDKYYRIHLTTYANDIIKNGGWLKFRTDVIREQADTNNQSKLKELLEVDSLRLQKENLEYSKTLRNRDEQIQNLTIKDLKRKTLYSIIGFVAGGVLTNIHDIINFVKTLIN